MTFEEIRNDIWWKAGRPTNWNPASDIEDGGNPKLNRLVNRAQKQIACWRDPQTFAVVHIPQLLSSFNRYAVVKTDTITAVSNTTFPYYIDLTTAGTDNDEYNDWGVEITSGSADGAFVVCMDYTGATRRLYYHEAFATAPAVGDTVSMYKNFDLLRFTGESWASEHITVPEDFLQLLSIVDVANETELRPAVEKEKFERSVGLTGAPTQWAPFGEKILYDKWLSEAAWYRIEYYRRPVDLVNDADEPELDEPYHQAIVLWGLYSLQESLHEVSKSQKTWGDLVNHMRSVVSAHDVRDVRKETKMRLRLK